MSLPCCRRLRPKQLERTWHIPSGRGATIRMAERMILNMFVHTTGGGAPIPKKKKPPQGEVCPGSLRCVQRVSSHPKYTFLTKAITGRDRRTIRSRIRTQPASDLTNLDEHPAGMSINKRERIRPCLPTHHASGQTPHRERTKKKRSLSSRHSIHLKWPGLGGERTRRMHKERKQIFMAVSLNYGRWRYPTEGTEAELTNLVSWSQGEGTRIRVRRSSTGALLGVARRTPPANEEFWGLSFSVVSGQPENIEARAKHKIRRD